MGQGDLLDHSFSTKRGSKEKSNHGRRTNCEDGNTTGKGRAIGRRSDSLMKMNPRGMKNENASQPANTSTAATSIFRYI